MIAATIIYSFVIDCMDPVDVVSGVQQLKPELELTKDCGGFRVMGQSIDLSALFFKNTPKKTKTKPHSEELTEHKTQRHCV